MSLTIPRNLLVALFVTGASLSLAAVAQAQTDDAMEDRIEHRFDTSTVVDKYDLKVSVKNGVATLSGDVATEAQKADAARLAHVTGITAVENQITVNKDADQTLADKAKKGLSKTGEAITDTWITSKVKYRIVNDDHLDGSDINVETKDHVVTLKGTVKSPAQKDHASALARKADGVKNVVNQLTIPTM